MTPKPILTLLPTHFVKTSTSFLNIDENRSLATFKPQSSFSNCSSRVSKLSHLLPYRNIITQSYLSKCGMKNVEKGQKGN